MSERRGYERIQWLEELEGVDIHGHEWQLPRHQRMEAKAVLVECTAALIETLQPLLEAWSTPKVYIP